MTTVELLMEVLSEAIQTDGPDEQQALDRLVAYLCQDKAILDLLAHVYLGRPLKP